MTHECQRSLVETALAIPREHQGICSRIGVAKEIISWMWIAGILSREHLNKLLKEEW